jgi:hypothetical protein
VVIPAPERAAQISAAGVAGMSQKANLATATEHGTRFQNAACLQRRVQYHLILTDKRSCAFVPVPILGILGRGENLSQGYGKKAKLSATIWKSVFCMSSPYHLDAESSRGKARIFL